LKNVETIHGVLFFNLEGSGFLFWFLGLLVWLFPLVSFQDIGFCLVFRMDSGNEFALVQFRFIGFGFYTRQSVLVLSFGFWFLVFYMDLDHLKFRSWFWLFASLFWLFADTKMVVEMRV
jgi:hypothetical protein